MNSSRSCFDAMHRSNRVWRNFLGYWLVVVITYAVVGVLRAHGSARGIWEHVWSRDAGDESR